MELQLSINGLIPNTSDTKPFFWSDTTTIEELVQKFLNQDIIKINYFSDYENFESIENIKSVNSHYKKFISKKYKTCMFYLTQDKNTDSNYVEFYCNHNSISLDLFVDIQLNSKQFLKLKELALAVYDDYHNQFIFGPIFNIRVRNLDYLRYRPKRNYKGLESNALLNFIHPPFFSSEHNLTEREDTKLIELEQFPDFVRHTEHNGLHLIQWIENLESEEEIQQALMNREDIIYQNLKLEPLFDFNEYGDKNIFHISALPEVPDKETFFNYYNDRQGTAFKLITLNENMEVSSEDVKKIKEYLKSKTLLTGDPLNKIILITPSRETAVKAEQQTQPLGIYKTMYLDNNADVWDMHPIGEWRN